MSISNRGITEYGVFENPEGKRKVVKVVSSIKSRPNYAELLNLVTYSEPRTRRSLRTTEYADLNNTVMVRPPHTSEAKAAVANAHESDPYLKNMTMYYTQYIFGDQIKPRLIPLQVDTP